MNKNQKAFEGYQKQAVEDILRRRISMDVFAEARLRADKLSAGTMQKRIELIAAQAR